MHLIDEYTQKQLETAHQTFLSIGYIRAPAVYMLGTVIGLALRDYCANSAEKGWAEKDPSLEDVFDGMQSMARQLVRQGEWPRPIYQATIPIGLGTFTDNVFATNKRPEHLR